MDANQALKLCQEGKAIMIDVREEEELRESGIIAGSQWMPTSKMDPAEDDWGKFKASLPKDKQILLYCRSGNRSGRVAEILRQDGYNTENIGGFKDLAAAKLPVKSFP